MRLAAGDIVLINAPYTDRLETKPRPCLVISGLQFNTSGPDVFLVPLSSNVRYDDPKQVVINDDDASFPETGLKHTSAIKCGAVFAFTKTQIYRKLGSVQQAVVEQVRNKVIEILTTD